MTEYCVCCGEENPEGSRVCSTCRQKSESRRNILYDVKTKPSTGILTLCGILFLLAALILACCNLSEDYRGLNHARKSAKALERTIAQSVREKAQQKSAVISEADSPLPEYLVNPVLPMPEAESDGHFYIGLLEIDSLSLELPIISRWSYDTLKLAPARYSGSAYQDNLVIAAHNYSGHFGHLSDLQEGDTVRFTDMDGNRFSYQVSEIDILEATALEEMVSGDWDLTLFTCTVGGSSRVTVRCQRL